MHGSERSIWFVGDLDDPWVAGIADAIPREVHRVNCVGEWPEGLFETLPESATLVIHRPQLSAQGAERLARLRKERPGSIRVVLCVGPHTRYADLVRWSPLVDSVLSEATAREIIARQIPGGEGRVESRGPSPRPSVDVVSSDYELRESLAEVCRSAGFPVRMAGDWRDVGPGGLAVWDVPVLEDDWSRTLERRTKNGTVVALIGFAERALVARARACGASACLDLPCDPADLIEVLDRVSLARADRPHEVPPPPQVLRRGRRPVVEPGHETYNETNLA